MSGSGEMQQSAEVDNGVSGEGARAPLNEGMGSDRLALFKEFIARDDFICTIGTQYARANLIDYTVLDEPDSSGSYLDQLIPATDSFISQGRKAWIIQFPREPESFTELKAIKEQLCGDLLGATICHNSWDKLDEVVKIARKFSKGRRSKLSPSKVPAALDPQAFLTELAIYMKPHLKRSDFDPKRTVISFCRKLGSMLPNVTPVVAGKGPLQQIVMSPLYHQSQVPPEPVLKEYEIPHGRFAPATCLVVVYAEDVTQSKKTAGGAETRRRVAKSTLVYNQYTQDKGRYAPSEILTGPYLIKPGAEADQYLMENTDQIVEELMPQVRLKGDAESAIMQAMSKLPPEVRMMMKMMGIGESPEEVLEFLQTMKAAAGKGGKGK